MYGHIIFFVANLVPLFVTHVIKPPMHEILSPAFECYHWSSEEKATLDAGENRLWLVKRTCENHFGFIFTQGDDSKAFECGGCWCCQPRIQGTFKGVWLYIKFKIFFTVKYLNLVLYVFVM